MAGGRRCQTAITFERKLERLGAGPRAMCPIAAVPPDLIGADFSVDHCQVKAASFAHLVFVDGPVAPALDLLDKLLRARFAEV